MSRLQKTLRHRGLGSHFFLDALSFVPVVCDTSPLSYLVLIGEADILESLFGEILIPPVVEDERSSPQCSKGYPNVDQDTA